MDLIRVGAGVVNTTPLDWDRNLAGVLGCIGTARERGVAVLALPELCLTGYGCEDTFLAPHVTRAAWEVLEEVLPHTRGIAVSVGLPVRHRGALFNCVALLADGDVLGLVAKRHLAGDGLHYEPRWFKPWPRDVHGVLDVGGRHVPIGDVHFDLSGLRVGFEVCEDAWVAQRPGAELARLGVDVILNPSASHFAFGKDAIRRRFVLEGSRAFAVTYVYANLLGNEAGRALYDGGTMIASDGQMIAQGRRFRFVEHDVVDAVVDLDRTRTARVRTASATPDLADEPACVRRRFTWTRPEAPAPRDSAETLPLSREEEFARAVALGLHDYRRKSRSRGFVVSLSGGADSAACAVLSRLSVDLAAADLGVEALGQRLGSRGDVAALRRAELLCAWQPTENSGPTTAAAARAVADAVGADLVTLDVDPLWKAYRATAEAALGRALTWAQDDVALQNVQARARAPGVWLLANVRGALLLTTSNRSEAAVGYATMDGDTAGGLAPLGGIDKAFLLRWLAWMERSGLPETGPWPALACITAQAPTAELRPPSEHQTDEADLMPYPVLDVIERAAVADKRGPVEAWRAACAAFPERPAAELARWTERFFLLWTRNQWKRERYAPAFHVDEESLDPRTWCRFPILSGGYARELAALRAAAGLD